MELLPLESVPALSGWDRLFRLKRAEAVLPGWHGEFDVTPIVCGNPSCTCEEVTLAFREGEAHRGAAAIAFDVAVDLAGDAPASVQGLGARATKLGEEVAGVLTGAVRAEVRAALREHRRRQGRVREAVAEYVRRGESVPYAHVLVGGQPDDEDLHDVLEVIDLSGEVWEVVDFICARRECRCVEVVLDFVTFRGEDQLGFRVRVPLGGGAATFEDLSGLKLEQARSVFAEWERETAYDRTELRGRYDLLRTMATSAPVASAAKTAAKPAAKAAGPTAGAVARPVRVAADAVGRREPCPCGSGKRYKNCCGARG